MKINGIDTSKGGTTNTFIDWLWYRGYDIVTVDSTHANFQCYEATITDKSGYYKVTVLFGGCDSCHITARIDKINGTHKWYYGKTLGQIEAVVRQCMEGYTFEEHTEEPAEEAEENKEEDTMKYERMTKQAETTLETNGSVTFVYTTGEEKTVDTLDGIKTAITMAQNQVTEDICGMYAKETITENEKEETTMKSTITINTENATATFTAFDGTTYIYYIETRRYAKTTTNGKTKRIGKAEYESAKSEYEAAKELAEMAKREQDKLDAKPCIVRQDPTGTDLQNPATMDEWGGVDCSKCNVQNCVHRNCMRRNPRNVGGLGECPRLNVKPIIIDEGVDHTEKKTKKASKPRRSKDISYEGNGVTLTAKQVDFMSHLSDTDFWEHGLDSIIWVDILCDQIEGQFAGKPMTVGAMVSTLCEKGLGFRTKQKVNGHKATSFELTEMGKKIAGELGLA